MESIDRLHSKVRSPRASTVQLLTLSCLASAACNSVEVSSGNLDALHDGDGRYRYVADIRSEFRHFLVEGLPGASGLGYELTESTPIENPSGRTLEAVIDLSGNDGSRPGVGAAQVRHFIWLALQDPSYLVRERCVLELGQAGRRLGLESPLRHDPLQKTATAAELAELVDGLGEAVLPILEASGRANATQMADLGAACELLGKAHLDVEGGRRILAAFERLLSGAAGTELGLLALFDLNLAVQAHMVELVLSMTLNAHPSRIHPRVRVATFKAHFRTYGERTFGAILLTVARELKDSRDQRRRTDGSPILFTYREAELVGLFELLAKNGIPTPLDLDEQGRAALRYKTLELLTTVSFDFSAFSDRTRAKAMQAMGAVSGAGIQSLRFEEWYEWWREESESFLASLDAAGAGSATEEAGSTRTGGPPEEQKGAGGR